MKSTNDVLDHHLEAIEQGDVNAILSDYAPNALLFRGDGMFEGIDAIRPVFKTFVAEFQRPLATDTFVVREGKIVAQSFTAKVTPKEEVSDRRLEE